MTIEANGFRIEHDPLFGWRGAWFVHKDKIVMGSFHTEAEAEAYISGALGLQVFSSPYHPPGERQ